MIKLSSVRVQGFRLLEDIEVAIETDATVIVGRNNSGKTSLTEVFEKFLGEAAGAFRLEDFAAAIRPQFLSAKALRDEAKPPEEVLAALPTIALELTFRFSADADDLGPLSPFIIDLDPDCTSAIARIEYAPSLKTLAALLDIPAPVDDAEPIQALFHHLRETIATAYSIKTYAIDPTDNNNRRQFDKTGPLLALIQTGFVKAQRTLDVSRGHRNHCTVKHDKKEHFRKMAMARIEPLATLDLSRLNVRSRQHCGHKEIATKYCG